MLSAQLFAAADAAKRMEEKVEYLLTQGEYLTNRVYELEDENSKLKDKLKRVSQLLVNAAEILGEE